MFQMQSWEHAKDERVEGRWEPMENGKAKKPWRPRKTAEEAIAKCMQWTGLLYLPAMQVVDLDTGRVVWRGVPICFECRGNGHGDGGDPQADFVCEWCGGSGLAREGVGEPIHHELEEAIARRVEASWDETLIRVQRPDYVEDDQEALF